MGNVQSEQAKGLTLEREIMIMMTTTTTTTTTTNYGSTADACD
jgi:hypothetical protein